MMEYVLWFCLFDNALHLYSGRKKYSAGIRGLCDNKGEVFLMFSKHIGVRDSNEEEVLARSSDIFWLQFRTC